MRFFIDKILHLIIGWNERQLTEADFYSVCKRHNIDVHEEPLNVSGFYYRVLGQDFIVVDSKLAGTEKLAVLFHELGHFLFHAPESGPAANFHGIGRRTRKECEADVFAVCSIIPRTWIVTRSPQELIDHEALPADLIAERLRILDRYRL